jgi:hypothetical protein
MQALTLSRHQVAFADRILLNKTDLVVEEADLVDIERRLKGINPHAPIIRCSHSKVMTVAAAHCEIGWDGGWWQWWLRCGGGIPIHPMNVLLSATLQSVLQRTKGPSEALIHFIRIPRS